MKSLRMLTLAGAAVAATLAIPATAAGPRDFGHQDRHPMGQRVAGAGLIDVRGRHDHVEVGRERLVQCRQALRLDPIACRKEDRQAVVGGGRASGEGAEEGRQEEQETHSVWMHGDPSFAGWAARCQVAEEGAGRASSAHGPVAGVGWAVKLGDLGRSRLSGAGQGVAVQWSTDHVALLLVRPVEFLEHLIRDVERVLVEDDDLDAAFAALVHDQRDAALLRQQHAFAEQLDDQATAAGAERQAKTQAAEPVAASAARK